MEEVKLVKEGKEILGIYKDRDRIYKEWLRVINKVE